MKVKAFAKINLALDVVGKREDGYHDLEMVMAPITLHDLIYLDIIEEGIIIDSNSVTMPKDERNIAYRVAQLLMERFNIDKGIKIFIYKHIPTQAGLAGGSADGAAVMRAMNKLFRLNLTRNELAQLGKEVGSDIPFCVHQRLAYVEGVGERLQFINTPFKAYLLLVKPKKGISTKKAFNNLDIDSAKHLDCRKIKEGIEKEDYQMVIDNLQNTLEDPSIAMVSDIQVIKERMLQLGFDNALMSGSGSCVFGITRKREVLEKGFRHFRNKYRFVRKSAILNPKNT